MNPTRGKGSPAVAWESVRARLAAATRAAEEGLQPSPERARALLDERARRLARSPVEAKAAGELLEVAVFSLANERYAIETRLVREIVRFVDFTPVPGAADFLVGVTNLRGEILAVVDLRRFFDLPVRGLTDHSRVIVLGRPSTALGVLADQAHEVAVLPASEVLEPATAATHIGRQYVRGVTKDALVVLDANALLGDARLVIDHSESIRRSERPE